jgi:hypothetical protein
MSDKAERDRFDRLRISLALGDILAKLSQFTLVYAAEAKLSGLRRCTTGAGEVSFLETCGGSNCSKRKRESISYYIAQISEERRGNTYLALEIVLDAKRACRLFYTAY